MTEETTQEEVVDTASTFKEAQRRSDATWAKLRAGETKGFRVLTGDRPTGALHVGHLFGTLQNRVRIQDLGVETFIVVADYQVLTDRDTADAIEDNVRDVVLDYLAAGLDPKRSTIFPHSHVPELNQLLLAFLPLVSMPELDRNPTVKEEIKAANLRTVNAAMYVYPLHQAADILFCKGNLVPVGKDQLPHLELSRKVARRFNERFSADVFPPVHALLSDIPVVLGLDGQKMSKSRGNAVLLKHTAEETAKLIKGAKTDSDRNIAYDPDGRPEVSNLLRLIAACTDDTPEAVAARIGDGGGGKLKATLTEALNAFLAPMRAERKRYEAAPDHLQSILRDGIVRAREVGEKTLREVRKAMNMSYSL
ncbi:MAG: tryptophan--tRNA ligase [Myxococcales bacterium]|nr:tryptophan--tRNA ligase [Myxococcales bacterium]